MQIRTLILAALAGALTTASRAADSGGSFNLADAIGIALDNNPELRSSGAGVDAATGRARQAKFWSNPELTLNVEEWPVNDGRGYSDSKKTVGVAQTIPFPGKKKLDRQIGVSGVHLSEAELNLRRAELVRDVKSAFYDVLAAEQLVEVAGELVKVAESSAGTARKRVTAGAAADHEQLRAEILMEEAKAELRDFQRDLVSARQTLAMLLGRPDMAETPVSGVLGKTAHLALLDQGPEQWLASHPGVVAAKTSRDQTQLELRRARLEAYPDVRMDVSGGRIGETGQSIIQLGFAVPLPVIDRSKGKTLEAQANFRMAEAGQAAIEQRLLRAWGTTSKRYRTAIEQVAGYRERILPKADEALRLVQSGFEQGKFGFIDLLDTQRTAAEARLAYQRKLLELNVARAELEALIAGSGGRTEPIRTNQSKTKEQGNDL